eukprot:403366932
MEPLVKHQYDLIVVGLGISGLWLSYLASSQNLKVLALDKNPQSCYLMTASNGLTRRYHPTQGADLEGSLSMFDQLQMKALQNGFNRGLEFYRKQKMTYVMDEIRGDYLKQIAQEITPEDVRHHYPRFEVSDLKKCLINRDSSGLMFCDRIVSDLKLMSLHQGCNFHYNKHAIKIAKNFVVTADGDTHTSDFVAVCTNGEGFYDKFGLTPLLVRSATLTGDCAGLPEMFTDMTKEGNGFYGQRTGELLDQYIIGMTEYKNNVQIQEYINRRFPGGRIAEMHEYLDLRKDGKLSFVCEKDQDGLYHLYSPPYRLAPLYAKDILDMMMKDKISQISENISESQKL